MDPRCEEVRELAPELALGIVEGEERGRALEHLADCPDCRRRVEELSEVADQLLLLAPHREAPVGFESRVLDRVLPAPRPRRRRRRLALVLAPAGAALASVAITLGIVSGDLRDASHYHQTLQEANGKEFEAYSLYGGGGAFAGTVFSYQGRPNWLVITVDPAHRADLTTAQLVMNDGSQIPVSWFHLDASGSSGGGIPVDPHNVSVLRLLPGAGGQPLVAHFSS
ncbi:MAG TPA: zf-HC2 domain-containing protein [Solirubrobacterales bacterium]|nr:zf-HC2 domain-containing protein [Solirubrobacterales bacterium]